MSNEEAALKKLRAMGAIVSQTPACGKGVRLAGNQFRDDVLLVVAELKDVTTLDIEGSSITDAGLVIAKRLPALQVVRINDAQATALAMNLISDLADLRDVFVCGRRIEFAQPQEAITGATIKTPGRAASATMESRQVTPSSNEMREWTLKLNGDVFTAKYIGCLTDDDERCGFTFEDIYKKKTSVGFGALIDEDEAFILLNFPDLELKVSRPETKQTNQDDTTLLWILGAIAAIALIGYLLVSESSRPPRGSRPDSIYYDEWDDRSNTGSPH